MSATDKAFGERPLRVMAAVASLVALQPGVTGGAMLLMLAGAAWIAVRAPFGTGAWMLACLVLSAAAIQSGLSPALAMASFVVAVAATPGVTFGDARWVVPWIGALALTQLPAIVREMLVASDTGPEWVGMVIVPCVFLVAATAGGALRLVWSTAAVLLVLTIGYAAYQLEWNPPLQATLAALPGAGAFLTSSPRAASRSLLTAVLLAIGMGASLWGLVPAIGHPGTLSVWIPEGNSPISRYFEQYDAVLRASGFRSVRLVAAAHDVKVGDWVLLPNAAHPELKKQLQQLRELPHYASLRIVVAGEHTDAEGVASALGASGSPIGLHADTTIPPGNADLLGWSSGLGAVPDRALALNRGASIDAREWRAMPLVWMQGGHREADRSDDGRLGDMVLRRGERAGLYGVLALGREPGGAAWVILGDSTPALNEYLAADPVAFARILALASGVPAFFGVLAWGLLYWGSAVQGKSRRGRVLRLAVAFSALAATALSIQAITLGFRDASQSRVVIVDRDPYGDRAVGRAVVALSHDVLDANVTLEIGRVTPDAQHNRISVGHPRGWVDRLDCTRAGNVSVDTIRVLDVVTCPEAQANSILAVGADAIAYRRGNQIVVLDQHFLANAAPTANVEWLREKVREMKR